MKNKLYRAKLIDRNLSYSLRVIFSAALLLGITNTSHAGVIALSSTLDVKATTGLTTFEVIDLATASQGGSINTLGVLNANATSTSAGGTSITSGSATATWNNTASGQVKFDNMGWDNAGFTNQTVSFSSLAGTAWSYTFIADVTGFFSLDWDVALQQPLSESFGLQDIRFSLALAGGGGGQTVMQADTTGSATRNIFAGNQYTALIQTNAGIFGGVGGRTSFIDGVFNWSMDSGPMPSVPEPTFIVLLGFGLFGLCISKRKQLSKVEG